MAGELVYFNWSAVERTHLYLERGASLDTTWDDCDTLETALKGAADRGFRVFCRPEGPLLARFKYGPQILRTFGLREVELDEVPEAPADFDSSGFAPYTVKL